MRLKNTSLWWRIFIFFALFVVISGTLGPMIINHSLVGKFGFQVYGGSGKALIFAAIAFGFLVYRTRRPFQVDAWQRRNLIWLVPSVASYELAYAAITRLQQGTAGILWPALAHIGMVGAVALTALAVLGWQELRGLAQTYKRELLIALALGVGFYIFLTLVYSLWEVLSNTVMHANRALLRAVGLEVYIIPPRTLLLDKFSVEISQFCSGIESIALFTGLYAIVGVVDRERLNFRKYAAVFLPALLLLFGCNILRVCILILAAYFINAHIAFSLFHTYAGMIFFIIYSAIFWRLAYKWMLQIKPESGGKA